MKIYIRNFNIDILDIIAKKLQKYVIGNESYIQIYSVEDIYKISDKTIHKLSCIDNIIQIHENYFENFTLIVDNSYSKMELTTTIHPEHISIQTTRQFYKINSTSNLQLVIESDNVKQNDIYFELSNNTDITDALVKKELIVFLSVLNNIAI